MIINHGYLQGNSIQQSKSKSLLICDKINGNTEIMLSKISEAQKYKQLTYSEEVTNLVSQKRRVEK